MQQQSHSAVCLNANFLPGLGSPVLSDGLNQGGIYLIYPSRLKIEMNYLPPPSYTKMSARLGFVPLVCNILHWPAQVREEKSVNSLELASLEPPASQPAKLSLFGGIQTLKLKTLCLQPAPAPALALTMLSWTWWSDSIKCVVSLSIVTQIVIVLNSSNLCSGPPRAQTSRCGIL